MDHSPCDNARGADNQQERLILLGWITGFVDGEGCFSIGIIRQPCRSADHVDRLRYQVTHEFAVTQGAKSISSLHELYCYFRVGQIVGNPRYDNHKEHLYRNVVRRRTDLLETIIPFFEKNPLRTSKRHDFQKFARCVRLIQGGHHLTADGLADVLEVMQTMNRRKSRLDLIRILRDYTPDTSDME
jgi:hypothetical protein